jgi:hypothetical protein
MNGSIVKKLMPGVIPLLAWAALATPAPVQPVESCPRCGWAPPQTAITTSVRSINDLRQAMGRARPGTTILLEDGVYRVDDG